MLPELGPEHGGGGSLAKIDRVRLEPGIGLEERRAVSLLAPDDVTRGQPRRGSPPGIHFFELGGAPRIKQHIPPRAFTAPRYASDRSAEEGSRRAAPHPDRRTMRTGLVPKVGSSRPRSLVPREIGSAKFARQGSSVEVVQPHQHQLQNQPLPRTPRSAGAALISAPSLRPRKFAPSVHSPQTSAGHIAREIDPTGVSPLNPHHWFSVSCTSSASGNTASSACGRSSHLIP
jgi:hypothetical protein